MTQNWTKTITIKNMAIKFKKYKKDVINGYVYVEKYHKIYNYLYHII